MLEVRKVFKSYGNVPILKGVDFSVTGGQVVAVVGASGAGKSTLLHMMGTLDTPDDGKVIIDGIDVFALKQKELALFRNKNIGFIFQFHNLLPEFTALENVCLPGYLGDRNTRNVMRKGKELLDMLGLGKKHGSKPSEMSGGEQQRTAVARALINSPAIVFADEPTGNLDSKNAEELHQLFFDLRKELNQTFIIVTHNMELAKHTDQVYEMKDGYLVNH
ncbi:MAG: ABC transporter ATP-binding protein [Cytophagales bacterium]|nr:ABC transporter ATP-binding protein [Cytophagales bacterium]